MDIQHERTMVEIYDGRTGEAREQFLQTHGLTHERIEKYRRICGITPANPPENSKLRNMLDQIKNEKPRK